MADQNRGAEERLAAGLNDLLPLEQDAVRAYTLAFENLRSERLRLAVRVFLGEHQRHMGDLSSLLRARGATPGEVGQPIPPGAFEQALRVAAGEGDAGMLEAMRVNESRLRGRYRALAAEALPGDSLAVVQRLVGDEERHWAWLGQALQVLGLRPDAPAGMEQTAAGAAVPAAPQAIPVPESAAARTAGEIDERTEGPARGPVEGETAGAGAELAAAGAAGAGMAAGAAAGATAPRDEVAQAGAGVAGVGRGLRELPSHGSEPGRGEGERVRAAASAAGERALAATGSGLQEAARGLDRAASWARRQGGGFARMGPPAHQAARVLAREGTNLRRQDVAAVKRDVEGGVHEHPLGAVLLAAGLGYIVGRLLR